MRRNLFLTLTLTLIVAVSLTGCAAFQGATARDVATVALEAHNAVYDEHQIQADRPDLSEPERAQLNEIKSVLLRIHQPLIDYAEIVDTGRIPPADIEAAFRRALTELARIAREKAVE